MRGPDETDRTARSGRKRTHTHTHTPRKRVNTVADNQRASICVNQSFLWHSHETYRKGNSTLRSCCGVVCICASVTDVTSVLSNILKRMFTHTHTQPLEHMLNTRQHRLYYLATAERRDFTIAYLRTHTHTHIFAIPPRSEMPTSHTCECEDDDGTRQFLSLIRRTAGRPSAPHSHTTPPREILCHDKLCAHHSGCIHRSHSVPPPPPPVS